ncbi:hypothetical protein D3867_19980 (plasmid) [Azospirillum argentinense]|uniref:Uncharacterized protein n=1 Tax=Azospirillum brasilense TaxID=192 RepID=A0A4D8Q266_AZOBR|nr:hypothetical protein D3867_19980 [Azospirillum argentinense]
MVFGAADFPCHLSRSLARLLAHSLARSQDRSSAHSQDRSLAASLDGQTVDALLQILAHVHGHHVALHLLHQVLHQLQALYGALGQELRTYAKLT